MTFKPFHPPLTDKRTIAQLVNRYGLHEGMSKAVGLCPATAADLQAWRGLGRRDA